MLNINLPGSGHVGPKDAPGAGIIGTAHDFVPFPDPFRPHPRGLPDYMTSDERSAFDDATHFSRIREAMSYIDRVIKNHPPCNECFKKLPNRRTFKEIWDSNTIWLNYLGDAGSTAGETRGDFDIAISLSTLKKGKMFIVATIVHELAHIDGAPGREQPTLADGMPNLMAESTLKCCLLAPLFDPGATGAIDETIFGSNRPDNANA